MCDYNQINMATETNLEKNNNELGHQGWTQGCCCQTRSPRRVSNQCIANILFIVTFIVIIGLVVHLYTRQQLPEFRPKKVWSHKPTQTTSTTRMSRTERTKAASKKPTTKTATQYNVVTYGHIVYAHFVPKATQTLEKIQWDDNPRHAFSSHDVTLKRKNTDIVFGVPGVYDLSLMLVLQWRKPNATVIIEVLKNSRVLKVLKIGINGTFACRFLLRIFNIDERISFKVASDRPKEWIVRPLEASLDIVKVDKRI
ncbi:uncharacterized protein LOC135684227 isoform X2 [Rhopilema esculentum]